MLATAALTVLELCRARHPESRVGERAMLPTGVQKDREHSGVRLHQFRAVLGAARGGERTGFVWHERGSVVKMSSAPAVHGRGTCGQAKDDGNILH